MCVKFTIFKHYNLLAAIKKLSKSSAVKPKVIAEAISISWLRSNSREYSNHILVALSVAAIASTSSSNSNTKSCNLNCRGVMVVGILFVTFNILNNPSTTNISLNKPLTQVALERAVLIPLYFLNLLLFLIYLLIPLKYILKYL